MIDGTIWVAASDWSDKARSLKDEGWIGTDLCGVDRLGLEDKGGRFEAVVQMLHRSKRERLLVHVVALGDPPAVPSVTPVWPGLNFPEREAYDMFGIHFEGHPNLKRILMPDEWEGHPLRKDYGVGKVQVEFAPQPFLQIDSPGQDSVPFKADAGVDELGQSEGDRTGTGKEGAGHAAADEGSG